MEVLFLQEVGLVPTKLLVFLKSTEDLQITVAAMTGAIGSRFLVELRAVSQSSHDVACL